VFYVMMIVMGGLLPSCTSESVWVAEPQVWGEFSIHFETRPEHIRAGMNEFLIIVNRKGKRHIPDLMVHIRTDSSQWKQAIPDGALGVYRRAILVGDVHQDKLYLKLKYHGKEGELSFDLSPKTTASK
jgi:hypothetical protein